MHDMVDIQATDHEAGSGPAPRERLIDAATRLFCATGINSTGIDAVLREAGVAKMTLYKIFGSKDRLVEAVLAEEGARWRGWFLSALTRGEAGPREKLERIFPLLREWFEDKRFYGCPFINAVGEHDKNDDRLRTLALAHKAAILSAIAGLCEQAGAAEPAQVAHQIGLLIDGAIVAVMVTRDPALSDVAAQAAAALLDKALTPA